MRARRTELDLGRYASDKTGYLDRYDSSLESWVDKPIVLLELGINRGGSLLMWRDYFPVGTIIGIDIKLPSTFPDVDRVQMLRAVKAIPSF